MSEPEEISLAEAAELLGVSKRRVQAITRDGSGRLPVRPVKVGGITVHLVRRADVLSLAALSRGRGVRIADQKAKPRKGKK